MIVQSKTDKGNIVLNLQKPRATKVLQTALHKNPQSHEGCTDCLASSNIKGFQLVWLPYFSQLIQLFQLNDPIKQSQFNLNNQ